MNGPLAAARSIYPAGIEDAGAHRGTEIALTCGAGLLLCVCLFAGGGQGGLGDVAAQLLALGMLAWIGIRALRGPRLKWRTPKWVRRLAFLPLLLPVFQLLPLGLGGSDPGRAALAQQVAAVGSHLPWSISLNPTATETAMWSLLPAVAMFLLAQLLPARRQLQLLGVVIFAALANVFLGLMQEADGVHSPLRFYSPTNFFAAVGFFANRNHMASLLAMTMPLVMLATAWGITRRIAGHHFNTLLILSGFGVLGLLLLGILITKSRGGVLLAMLAFFAALPLVLSLRPTRGARRMIALGTLAAIVLVAQFALVGLLQRVGQDPMSDARWTYGRVTLEAARDYLPWGSGLGTFRLAYQPYEARGVPDRTIVNHAHDDYLELWLEGGVPALVLILIGLAAWGWRGLQLWVPRLHQPLDASTLLLPRTAWVAASLALVHSALDFPLRTTAAMSTFALLAAIAFCQAGGSRAVGSSQHRRPDHDTVALPES